MSEIVMLIFTGVIAVSTVVYTYYSIKLWKATRRSTDIARYTLFINFMLELHKMAEEARLMEKPDAPFLSQFEMVMLEMGADEALRGVKLKKRPDLMALIARIDGMLRANNVDPESIPYLRPLFRKLKE